jgi:HD superfamily phosphodiesterase
MNSDSTIDVPRFGAVYTELDEYYEYLVMARSKFALNIHHVHGEKHWMQVVKNARRIVRAEGGDLRVATLFGIFHDCCRENDRYDHEHGKRAADFVNHQAA